MGRASQTRLSRPMQSHLFSPDAPAVPPFFIVRFVAFRFWR